MKKVITLASAGIFLLSLQGASLGQEKAPSTATPPMTEKQAPAAPKAEAPAPKAPEVKAPETKSQSKATNKKSKAKQKAKSRKAKKQKAAPEE